MNFVTLDDLTRDTLAWAQGLHGHLAGVVGVPRSGMIPATILATRLNLPLADLEYFLSNSGRFYPSRMGGSQYAERKGVHVLVVDDSVWAGSTLRWADEELSRMELWGRFKYSFEAVYGHAGSPRPYFRAVEGPRLFEWNWTRAKDLQEAMLDMDGVICEDPSDEVCADRKLYLEWLPTARPLHLPTRKVRAIVSGRVEEDRAATEEWLARWGVRCEELLLVDAPHHVRTRFGLSAPHKKSIYADSASDLFVESNPTQARYIFQRTGKTVFVPPSPGRKAEVFER